MSATISGGTPPTLRLEEAYRSIVDPLFNAVGFELVYLFQKSNDPAFSVGDNVSQGIITEVRAPTQIGGNIYRQSVEACPMPDGLTVAESVVHTFPGRSSASSRSRRYGAIRPFTRNVVGRRKYEFMIQDAAALVTLQSARGPTFQGEPVDFFGTVYDDDGNSIGQTSPFIPSYGWQIVEDFVRPWRGQIWVRETLEVRRPFG